MPYTMIRTTTFLHFWQLFNLNPNKNYYIVKNIHAPIVIELGVVSMNSYDTLSAVSALNRH